MTLVEELKHLEGIKGNFMLSETEYLSPIILFEKGKVASQIVYSNLAQIVEQQQYFFDTLWSKTIPINISYVILLPNDKFSIHQAR